MADASSLYAAHYRGFFAGWTAFERSWAGLDSAALARVATELADRKVTLVPTLVLHETFSRLDDPAVSRYHAPRGARRGAGALEHPRHGPPGRLDHGGLSRLPGGPPGAGPLHPALRRRGRPDRDRHGCVESAAHPGLQRAP